MRVLRTILGLLLLIIGVPALLVGAAFWAAMQHRDPGGAFSGDLQRTATSGYAVVVPDADGLLRRDAPFARSGNTRLRLTAYSLDGPAFIGIGPADEVARYLDGVPRQVVTTVDLGTGALPVATDRIGGGRAPASVPGRQRFWLKSATGGLDWHPSELRDQHYSLVIMSPSAQPGLELTATANLSPGWLNSATWSLLIFGSLLVLAGIVVLAWPGRRREVVYVVEPSQVPDLMLAIGAPLPLSRTGGGRHAGSHRPRTLADAGARSAKHAVSPLGWPPAQSDSANAPVSPGVGGSARPVAGAPAGPGVPGVPPSPTEYAAKTAIPGRAHTPAPGEPLSLIGGVPGKGVQSAAALSSSAPSSVAPSSGSPLTSVTSGSTAAVGAIDEAVGSRTAERIGRRQAFVPASDTPVFEATAVGAWVAETAAARARETEARAAAVLAAEAAKRAGTKEAAGVAKPEPPAVAKPDAAGVAKPDAAGVAKPDAAGVSKLDAAGMVKQEAAAPAKPGAAAMVKPAAPGIAKAPAAGVGKPEAPDDGKPQAAVAKAEAAGVKADASKVGQSAGGAATKELPVNRPAVGTHAAPDETPGAPAARSGWSATGLRRADSPPSSAPAGQGPADIAVTPVGDPAQLAKGAGAAADGKAVGATTAEVATAGGETPIAAVHSAADRGSASTAKPGPDAAVVASPSPDRGGAAEAAPTPPPAENGQSRDPRSTAPAPARPAAPTRPIVPAPARPAPPRPTPEPTPNRPAAESPAQPAAMAANPAQPAAHAASPVQPVATAAAPIQPAATAVSAAQPAATAASPVQPAATAASAVQPAATAASPARPNPAAPSTPASDRPAPPARPTSPLTGEGPSQAPVHVPLSDRPAVVSQPGSSIPGGQSERQPTAAETPRTTSDIQARLQAAMKSPVRPPAEPRHSTAAGSPSSVSSPPARPASASDEVRIGVAGRRDYPASARRDNADATRSGRIVRPPASGTSAGTQDDREERGQADIAALKAGEHSADSVAHIAEQRVDPDQPPTTGDNSTGIGGESPGLGGTPTTASGKEKPRRSAAKGAKGDRSKPAKPEAAPPSVPGARLSAYAEEAAELLAGLSPDRRRNEDGGADAATDTRPTGKESAKD